MSQWVNLPLFTPMIKRWRHRYFNGMAYICMQNAWYVWEHVWTNLSGYTSNIIERYVQKSHQQSTYLRTIQCCADVCIDSTWFFFINIWHFYVIKHQVCIMHHSCFNMSTSNQKCRCDFRKYGKFYKVFDKFLIEKSNLFMKAYLPVFRKALYLRCFIGYFFVK